MEQAAQQLVSNRSGSAGLMVSSQESTPSKIDYVAQLPDEIITQEIAPRLAAYHELDTIAGIKGAITDLKRLRTNRHLKELLSDIEIANILKRFGITSATAKNIGQPVYLSVFPEMFSLASHKTYNEEREIVLAWLERAERAAAHNAPATT